MDHSDAEIIKQPAKQRSAKQIREELETILPQVQVDKELTNLINEELEKMSKSDLKLELMTADLEADIRRELRERCVNEQTLEESIKNLEEDVKKNKEKGLNIVAQRLDQELDLLQAIKVKLDKLNYLQLKWNKFEVSLHHNQNEDACLLGEIQEFFNEEKLDKKGLFKEIEIIRSHIDYYSNKNEPSLLEYFNARLSRFEEMGRKINDHDFFLKLKWQNYCGNFGFEEKDLLDLLARLKKDIEFYEKHKIHDVIPLLQRYQKDFLVFNDSAPLHIDEKAGKTSKIKTISRFVNDNQGSWSYASKKKIDAIDFKLEEPMMMVGIGLYTPDACHKLNEVTLKIKDVTQQGADRLLFKKKKINIIKENADHYIFKFMLEKPLSLEVGKTYTIRINTSGSDTHRGKGARTSFDPGFKIKFSGSSASNNSTSVDGGQIPELYYI